MVLLVGSGLTLGSGAGGAVTEAGTISLSGAWSLRCLGCPAPCSEAHRSPSVLHPAPALGGMC